MGLIRRSDPDAELYDAIVAAEGAARAAHSLCYRDGGHGAGPFLAMALGRAQSILISAVVRYAGRRRARVACTDR